MFRQKRGWMMVALLIGWKMYAQDLTLSPAEADSLFATRNLQVLAAHYHLTEAQAQVEQSKLYANPVIAVDENVYNRLNKKYFDFGPQSEQTVTADQLIAIAGQHANQVRLAKARSEGARWEFEELLRNLRSELHRTWVELFYTQQNLKMFQTEIISLHQVSDALQTQEKKGNISEIEMARIQALLLSLRQEQHEYETTELTLESELRTMLALPQGVHPHPQLDESVLDSLDADRTDLQNLYHYLEDRPDIRHAQNEINVAERTARLERSKAFPEIHLTGQYDRNAGYFPNYFSVGISMSLPVFNRNQGNRHAAQAQIAQNTLLYDEARMKAHNELDTASEKLRKALSLWHDVSREFDRQNIGILFKGVNENYKKRNISLLEFVDFYKTYKDAMLQIASVKQGAFLAIEELNTTAGTAAIRY